ncbi:MAG TPA: hypothetical protein VJ833_08850 [Rhodanobacteraceae bacterium]|nr:hypothetical protein [Rhodanobacteraceae bacterium]
MPAYQKTAQWNPDFAVIPELPAPSMALALRAAAACPGLDPGAFAFAILQTQSRSDIGPNISLQALQERGWVPAFLAPQNAAFHGRSPRRLDGE